MKIPKLVKVLLIIFFPLGIVYCLIHTLGKDFSCFIGLICAVGIGILLGIYIGKPEIIQNALETVKNIFVK